MSSHRTNGELLVVPYSWHHWKLFGGLSWAEVQQLPNCQVSTVSQLAVGKCPSSGADCLAAAAGAAASGYCYPF
jgi:hypothetical protein